MFNKNTDFKVGDVVVYTPETLDPSYVLGTGMGWSVTDSLSHKDRKHLGAIPPGQELVVSEVYHHAEFNLNLLRFNGMTEGIRYNPTQFTLKSIYDMQQQTASAPKLTLQTAVVKPANKELYQFLIDYAKGKGVPVYEGTSSDDFGEWPFLCFSDGDICNSKWVFNGDTLVDTEHYMQLIDAYKPELPEKIQLPSIGDWEVVVDFEKKRLKIGCQHVVFEKIDELIARLDGPPDGSTINDVFSNKCVEVLSIEHLIFLRKIYSKTGLSNKYLEDMYYGKYQYIVLSDGYLAMSSGIGNREQISTDDFIKCMERVSGNTDEFQITDEYKLIIGDGSTYVNNRSGRRIISDIWRNIHKEIHSRDEA